MKAFDLTVTICSWNTLEDLRLCLESIGQERESCSFETIVVDNGSQDGSPEMVRDRFPWVELLAQSENLGFTGGHNLAIHHAKGRHVMLLNSDTVVHPGALLELLNAADAHPEVGIFGAKLLNPDGSLQYSCRRFPNPTAALFRNTFVGKLFPKNKYTRDYLMQDWDHSSVKEVDWVSGAALLITQSALPKVHQLDPEFFMFCEDVDICWRTWKSGLKVMYWPASVITHKIGGSTSQVANKMIVRFHRSMLLFFRKHQLGDVFLPLRPLAYGGAALALSIRAGLFLTKNTIDKLRRAISR